MRRHCNDAPAQNLTYFQFTRQQALIFLNGGNT